MSIAILEREMMSSFRIAGFTAGWIGFITQADMNEAASQKLIFPVTTSTRWVTPLPWNEP
jgi:hypothetical protein